MLSINTKKLLLCLFSFFPHVSCMEITQLSKDVMQPIAGRLNFTSRQSLKSSCKALYCALKDEVLFLSPFNVENYHKLMNDQYNYLGLEQLFAASVILKLKIFAARQEDKNKQMFIDVMTQCGGESCSEIGCEFRNLSREDMIMGKKELIELYKKEWEWNNTGNTHHFDALMKAIKANCKPRVDLLIAQGIDINATDARDQTVLHKTCKNAEYAWATKKLVDHTLCDVNVTSRRCKVTPLYCAAIFSGISSKNLQILLTRADLKIDCKDSDGYTPWHYAKIDNGRPKNLFLTAYPYFCRSNKNG